MKPNLALLKLLVLLQWNALPFAQTTHPTSSGDSIVQCYQQTRNWDPGVFEHFLKGELARLHIHNVYWSEKEVSPKMLEPRLGIFTATTLSRMDALLALCRAWSGVLSAVVYTPVKHKSGGSELDEDAKRTLHDATNLSQQLFRRMEAEAASCVLRLILVYEPVGDDLLGLMLPINSLRNTALLALDTPLVVMLDVDLLPSNGLNRIAKNAGRWKEIADMCEKKQMVVLPAFETDGMPVSDGQRLVTVLSSRAEKARVIHAVNEGSLIPFALKAYAPGHMATDFDRWYTAKEPYTVEYTPNFEPWYITKREDVFMYDARFRGYGWNKVTQVFHQHNSSFAFVVHPDLYLLHRSHLKSDAQALYRAAYAASEDATQTEDVPPAKLAHRRVAALRHSVMRQVFKKQYVVSPGDGVQSCLEALPWWKGLHPTLGIAAAGTAT